MPSKICKGCCLKIGFFKKKLACQICAGFYCSACSESVKGKAEQLREKLVGLNGFHCLCCVVLNFGGIKREHLNLLQNRQLVEYCNEKNISTVSCREKYDLIDLIMEYAKTNHLLNQQDVVQENVHDDHLRTLQQAANNLREQEAISQRNQTDFSDYVTSTNNDTPEQPSAYTQQQQQHEQQQHRQQQQHEQQQHEHEQPQHEQPQQHEQQTYQQEQHEQQHDQNQQQTSSRSTLSPSNNSQSSRSKWKSMEDVSTADEIAGLTVLELKQILTANFIDYKGCVEKKELIDKVTMLYESIQKNKERVDELEHKTGDGESPRENYERDTCKICMDATIDCVLLNCGHLVACSKCGKRLSECPICRAMVIRVVHIFRV